MFGANWSEYVARTFVSLHIYERHTHTRIWLYGRMQSDINENVATHWRLHYTRLSIRRRALFLIYNVIFRNLHFIEFTRPKDARYRSLISRTRSRLVLQAIVIDIKIYYFYVVGT